LIFDSPSEDQEKNHIPKQVKQISMEEHGCNERRDS